MTGLPKIFLSYARRDASDLAERLFADLSANNCDVWQDIKRLGSGNSWTVEIERGLDRADVILALLSPASLDSNICRAEQLRSLRKGKCVIPILAIANVDVPLHLEFKQYCDFSDPSRYTDEFSKLLADITLRAGDALRQTHRQTYITAPPLPVNYIERPGVLATLREALVNEDSVRHVALTALRGMGGIGKTMLAQALCHDEIAQAAFPDGIIWISLGPRPPDLVGQMREIAKAIGEPTDGYDTPDTSINRVRNALRSKAVLLVIDDVWDVHHVEPFCVGGPRCRLLLTTRDGRIGAALGAREHTLDVLTEEESLELLAAWSQQSRGSLPSAANAIVRECGRLPLALGMVGASVRDKPDRWASVLHRLRHADLERIGQQVVGYPHPTLYRAIRVSVDVLDEAVRRRYLRLAVFPGDMPIPKSALQVIWGMDSFDAAEMMYTLVDLSLAQRRGTDSDSIVLHDLQAAFVRWETGDEGLLRLHNELLDAYNARCGARWLDGPNDGYFFEKLPYHLSCAGRNEELRHLLCDFSWLTTKLEKTNVTALLADFEFVTDEDLTLIHRAIRLSAHILLVDKTQLSSQLLGRLPSRLTPTIAALVSDAREKAPAPAILPCSFCLTQPGGPLIRTLTGHTGEVTAVVAAVAGSRAVSASWDATLKVWDIATGLELRTLVGHVGRVNGAAITRDGRTVLSASSDCTIRVWDVDSGSERFILSGHTGAVRVVIFSADERMAISASSDRTIRLWDLRTGRELEIYNPHHDEVAGLAICPRTGNVASASYDRTITVWNLINPAVKRTFSGHLKTVRSVAFLDEGLRLISASDDRTLRLWNIDNGESVTLTGHGREVLTVAAGRDGRIISAGGDRTVKVWDLRTRQVSRTLTGHTDWINSVCLTPCGTRILSASDDYTLKVWDLTSDVERLIPRGHSRLVNSVAITNDGRSAVSASDDFTLRIWDVVSGKHGMSLEGHSDWVRCVAMTPDGNTAVSGSWDRTLRIWSLGTGTLLGVLQGHTDAVTAVAINYKGTLAVSASDDGALRLWDVLAQRQLAVLRGHAEGVTGVAMSSDGTRAISSSHDHTLKVWNLQARTEVGSLLGHSLRVTSIALSATGRRALSASWDEMLIYWDVERQVSLRKIYNVGEITRVALSADGLMSVCVSMDGHVRVWDMERESPSPICTFTAEEPLMSCAATSNLEFIVAGGSSGNVYFLELRKTRTLSQVRGATARLEASAASEVT